MVDETSKDFVFRVHLTRASVSNINDALHTLACRYAQDPSLVNDTKCFASTQACVQQPKMLLRFTFDGKVEDVLFSPSNASIDGKTANSDEVHTVRPYSFLYRIRADSVTELAVSLSNRFATLQVFVAMEQDGSDSILAPVVSEGPQELPSIDVYASMALLATGTISLLELLLSSDPNFSFSVYTEMDNDITGSWLSQPGTAPPSLMTTSTSPLSDGGCSSATVGVIISMEEVRDVVFQFHALRLRAVPTGDFKLDYFLAPLFPVPEAAALSPNGKRSVEGSVSKRGTAFLFESQLPPLTLRTPYLTLLSQCIRLTIVPIGATPPLNGRNGQDAQAYGPFDVNLVDLLREVKGETQVVPFQVNRPGVPIEIEGALEVKQLPIVVSEMRQLMRRGSLSSASFGVLGKVTGRAGMTTTASSVNHTLCYPQSEITTHSGCSFEAAEFLESGNVRAKSGAGLTPSPPLCSTGDREDVHQRDNSGETSGFASNSCVLFSIPPPLPERPVFPYRHEEDDTLFNTTSSCDSVVILGAPFSSPEPQERIPHASQVASSTDIPGASICTDSENHALSGTRRVGEDASREDVAVAECSNVSDRYRGTGKLYEGRPLFLSAPSTAQKMRIHSGEEELQTAGEMTPHAPALPAPSFRPRGESMPLVQDNVFNTPKELHSDSSTHILPSRDDEESMHVAELAKDFLSAFHSLEERIHAEKNGTRDGNGVINQEDSQHRAVQLDPSPTSQNEVPVVQSGSCVPLMETKTTLLTGGAKCYVRGGYPMQSTTPELREGSSTDVNGEWNPSLMHEGGGRSRWEARNVVCESTQCFEKSESFCFSRSCPSSRPMSSPNVIQGSCAFATRSCSTLLQRSSVGGRMRAGTPPRPTMHPYAPSRAQPPECISDRIVNTNRPSSAYVAGAAMHAAFAGGALRVSNSRNRDDVPNRVVNGTLHTSPMSAMSAGSVRSDSRSLLNGSNVGNFDFLARATVGGSRRSPDLSAFFDRALSPPLHNGVRLNAPGICSYPREALMSHGSTIFLKDGTLGASKDSLQHGNEANRKFQEGDANYDVRRRSPNDLLGVFHNMLQGNSEANCCDESEGADNALSVTDGHTMQMMEKQVLLDAIQNGDRALVLHLLGRKPNIVLQIDNALHSSCAAPHSDPSIIEALLRLRPELLHGVDRLTGNTALHVACAASYPSPDVVKLLLLHHISISERNDAGLTAFHVAVLNINDVSNGLKDMLLVVGGADINERTADGRTALHLVCESDQYLPVVRYLVACGADLMMQAPYNEPRTNTTIWLTPAERSQECGLISATLCRFLQRRVQPRKSL